MQKDETMTVETGTALALPGKTEIATLFRAGGGIETLIERIEREARSHAPDLTTRKGRDAIKSLAFTVARTKTALDDAGKALNEEARTQINAVDAERRKVRDRLDALKDEVRKPLDDWEAAEAARVSALKERLERLRTAHASLPVDATAEQITALLARVDAAAIDATWQEFATEATLFKDQAVATLRHMLTLAEARAKAAEEAARQAAELEALRAEKAARDEADRLRREAEEAAERQRLADECAKAEREAAAKAEADRAARIEAEKIEAARVAAAQAEAKAKADAEKAAREAAEREAELRRQIEAQKIASEQAAQAERDRIAAQERAEADARAKREADLAHRAKIKGDIAAALKAMAGAATPDAIAEAMMAGKIPHVRVVM